MTILILTILYYGISAILITIFSHTMWLGFAIAAGLISAVLILTVLLLVYIKYIYKY